MESFASLLSEDVFEIQCLVSLLPIVSHSLGDLFSLHLVSGPQDKIDNPNAARCNELHRKTDSVAHDISTSLELSFMRP